LPGAEALTKCLKALATGRLPGAESPANLLIANELARALAPGKCAPGTGPGSTPGKLFYMIAGFSDAFWLMQAFYRLCQQLYEGLTPGKTLYDFFFKKRF